MRLPSWKTKLKQSSMVLFWVSFFSAAQAEQIYLECAGTFTDTIITRGNNGVPSPKQPAIYHVSLLPEKGEYLLNVDNSSAAVSGLLNTTDKSYFLSNNTSNTEAYQKFVMTIDREAESFSVDFLTMFYITLNGSDIRVSGECEQRTILHKF
jgi:hypothetical protein